MSSTAPQMWRTPQPPPGHDLLQNITPENRAISAIQATGGAARRTESPPKHSQKCPPQGGANVGIGPLAATSFMLASGWRTARREIDHHRRLSRLGLQLALGAGTDRIDLLLRDAVQLEVDLPGRHCPELGHR